MHHVGEAEDQSGALLRWASAWVRPGGVAQWGPLQDADDRDRLAHATTLGSTSEPMPGEREPNVVIPRPSLIEIGHIHRPELTTSWPTPGHFDHMLARSCMLGPNSTSFGPMSAKFDVRSAVPEQHRAFGKGSDQSCPTLQRVLLAGQPRRDAHQEQAHRLGASEGDSRAAQGEHARPSLATTARAFCRARARTRVRASGARMGA